MVIFDLFQKGLIGEIAQLLEREYRDAVAEDVEYEEIIEPNNDEL